MWVHQLKIENLKSFLGPPHDVDLDFERPDGRLAGWTVIAGRNGAGKSSFLQAIAVSLAGPETARTLQGSWSGWIRSGEPSAVVATRIRYSPSHDRFVETGRRPKQSFWTGLRWDATKQGPEPVMSAHRQTSH